MILERFRGSNDKPLHDIIGALFSAYGLWYGVCAYTAPNFFFGPDGKFPIVAKTATESNALDPISTHYLRLQGGALIALILHFYLFAIGNPAKERAAFKTFIISHVLISAQNVKTFTEDVEGYFAEGVLVLFTIPMIVQAIWLYYLLTTLPKETKVMQAPVSTKDRLHILLITVYTALVAVPRLFYGPNPAFFKYKGEYNALQNDSARTLGGVFAALVASVFVVSPPIPKLMHQQVCFLCLLFIPVYYKEVFEDESYEREPLIVINICTAVMAFASFARLGAFNKVKEVKHVKKASKAA